jgi:hypothetical protein
MINIPPILVNQYWLLRKKVPRAVNDIPRIKNAKEIPNTKKIV